MILVIAEKPLIAQAFADALPGNTSRVKSKYGYTYLTNGDYCITFTAGHALTLYDPEDYDEAYKKWDRAVLPLFFKDWKMKPSPSKVSIVQTIGDLIPQASLIINAGDIDDEGQRLVDEVIEYFNYKGPVKRIMTSDLSPAAMTKSLNNLEDNAKWYPLGLSAYARSVGDKMIGYNATRFFTLLNNSLLTVGRVQTPALGLVVNRDEAIKNHVKEKYYELNVAVDIDGYSPPSVESKFKPNKEFESLNDEGRVTNRDTLDKINAYMAGKSVKCFVRKKKEDEAAPLPFNLNKLTLYCSSKFNYDPQKVMDITQSLREKHKAITYNRSDSQYLTMEQFAEAPAVLARALSNLQMTDTIGKSVNPKRQSNCFDDSKVTAHTAIIPTNIKVDINTLSEEEKKVYTAICLYYIAQFMPPCSKENTYLDIPIGKGASFTAMSSEILKNGYRDAISPQIKDTETKFLSTIKAGEYNGKVVGGKVDDKETNPPRKYTKATLSDDMSRVVKYVKDPEIKRILLEKDKGTEGESGSIGTGATRAKIIDSLEERGFIEEKGKYIESTEKGREFYRLLPDELKKVDMTAHWWLIQEEIKRNTVTPQALFDDVLKTLKEVMSKTYPTLAAAKPDKESLGKCPLCGKPVYENKKSFYCSGYKEGCKFSLWKEGKAGVLKVLAYSKKKLTAAMVKEMLKDSKHQRMVKGLKSEKTGKTYDAYIVFAQNGDYTNLQFGGFPEKKSFKSKAKNK